MVAIQRRLDQSVQRTLRLIFALLGGMLLLVFVAWVVYGQFLLARVNTVYEDRVVPLRDLTLITQIINVRIPQSYQDGGYEGAAVQRLTQDWAQVESIWAGYMATYLTPREQVLAENARRSLDDIRVHLLRDGVESSLGWGNNSLIYQRDLRRFNERFTQLNELQVEVALENLHGARVVTHWAVVLAALMLLLMLLLSVLALQVVRQRVVAPVAWVVRALQHLAQGDVAPQHTGVALSAEFSGLREEVERVRHFVGERQRLLEEEQAVSRRLRDAQAELVEAEKLASLGSLVAGVAHELNTPIGVAVAVSSSLEEKRKVFTGALAGGGLKRSALDGFLADVQQAAELLQQNLARAASLVGSFKQVAVDRAGTQRRPFELAQTVDEILVSLRPSLRGRGIELRNELPAGIALDSYPGALGQVVSNLLNNAALHAFPEGGPAPEGGRCVRVSVFDAPAGQVGLRVSDNGQGMAADTLARVFEPFFTTRLGQGGSGLGMSIVRNIVIGLLGGRIQVQSQPGAGTVIDLLLPLVAPHRDASNVSQESVIYAVR
jgi:signal transduction histidine kinase